MFIFWNIVDIVPLPSLWASIIRMAADLYPVNQVVSEKNNNAYIDTFHDEPRFSPGRVGVNIRCNIR